MSKLCLGALVVLASCGTHVGTNADGNPGGDGSNPGGDGSTTDSPIVPSTITISGTTSEETASGKTLTAGVTVTAYNASDDSMAGTPATSDAQGAFSITITTNGTPLDGYLHAAKGTTYVDVYLYPPAPVATDFAGATVLLLTPSNFDLAATLAQVSGGQVSTDGFIGIEVFDATNTAVAGAVVATTPAGTVRYDAANGLPSKTPTSTAADGVAFVFNVAAGMVSVKATKTGTTFAAHSVNARAGAITETLIIP